MKHHQAKNGQQFAQSVRTIQSAGSFTSPAYDYIFGALASVTQEVPVSLPESLTLVDCIIKPTPEGEIPKEIVIAINELLRFGVLFNSAEQPARGIRVGLMPFHLYLLASMLRNKKITRLLPADEAVPILSDMVLKDINQKYPAHRIAILPHPNI